MKLWWEKQGARIDALSLRERVFLFLSIIVVWLTPAQSEHNRLKLQFDKQNEQLQKLRTELQILPQAVDPTRAARDELAQATVQLQTIDEAVRTASASATGATPLAQALVHFLKRHEGLTLVSTVALPVEAPVVAQAGQTAGQATAATGLTRQGVELTVAGSYSELTRYVQVLEKALPELRWGQMTLSSGKGPTQLILRVFIVGVQQ
jgi:MSHA biogenesis protein MshJ